VVYEKPSVVYEKPPMVFNFDFDRDGSIDDDKLCEVFSDNINFIDHKLPTRLKPELQLPINIQE
jgi:hypothetical protein